MREAALDRTTRKMLGTDTRTPLVSSLMPLRSTARDSLIPSRDHTQMVVLVPAATMRLPGHEKAATLTALRMALLASVLQAASARDFLNAGALEAVLMPSVLRR